MYDKDRWKTINTTWRVINFSHSIHQAELRALQYFLLSSRLNTFTFLPLPEVIIVEWDTDNSVIVITINMYDRRICNIFHEPDQIPDGWVSIEFYYEAKAKAMARSLSLSRRHYVIVRMVYNLCVHIQSIVCVWQLEKLLKKLKLLI